MIRVSRRGLARNLPEPVNLVLTGRAASGCAEHRSDPADDAVRAKRDIGICLKETLPIVRRPGDGAAASGLEAAPEDWMQMAGPDRAA